MKKQLLFILLFVLLSGIAFSQTGINTRTPNSKTILHTDESGGPLPVYKGVLVARYTTTQRDAIFTALTAADNSLLIYNTTENCFNYWQLSTGWTSICGCNPPTASSTLLFYARCNQATRSSNFTTGVAVSGSIKVPVKVIKPGTINPINLTINGIMFTMASSVLTTSTTEITLNYSGTPTAASAINLPINDNQGFKICGVIIPVN